MLTNVFPVILKIKILHFKFLNIYKIVGKKNLYAYIVQYINEIQVLSSNDLNSFVYKLNNCT
jgi:hypothetical protein